VPVTMWGTASGQNFQVMAGAVLARKSGRLPPACRGVRCLGYPPRQPCHDRSRARAGRQQELTGRSSRRRRHRYPGAGPAPDSAGLGQSKTILRTIGLTSVGQLL
jgi:hypothetical protein